MSDVEVMERVPGERVRIAAPGRRSDDGSDCTLLVIHEADGSWSIHGLGAPGVRLSRIDMIDLAKKIVASRR